MQVLHNPSTKAKVGLSCSLLTQVFPVIVGREYCFCAMMLCESLPEGNAKLVNSRLANLCPAQCSGSSTWLHLDPDTVLMLCGAAPTPLVQKRGGGLGSSLSGTGQIRGDYVTCIVKMWLVSQGVACTVKAWLA